MKKRNKKTLLAISAGLVLSASALNSQALASTLSKIQGVIASDVTVTKNNQLVSLGVDDLTGKAYHPIIINDRTYLPVKAVSEIVGLQVGWDHFNRQVKIIDNGSEELNHYIKLDAANKVKIFELEKKIEELEKKEDKKEDDLKDLEDKLRKNYRNYKGIDYSFKVSGDKDKLKVTVDFSSRDRYEWDRMSESQIEGLAKDIIYDITRDFKKAEIRGYIEEDRSSKTLVEFGVDSRDREYVDILDHKGSSSNVSDKLYDVEKKLDKDLGRFEAGSKRIDFKFKAKDKSSKLVLIEVDVYEKDWDYLAKSEIKDFYYDIEDIVNKYFDRVDVEIEVKDGKRILDDYRS